MKMKAYKTTTGKTFLIYTEMGFLVLYIPSNQDMLWKGEPRSLNEGTFSYTYAIHIILYFSAPFILTVPQLFQFDKYLHKCIHREREWVIVNVAK